MSEITKKEKRELFKVIVIVVLVTSMLLAGFNFYYSYKNANWEVTGTIIAYDIPGEIEFCPTENWCVTAKSNPVIFYIISFFYFLLFELAIVLGLFIATYILRFIFYTFPTWKTRVKHQNSNKRSNRHDQN